MEKSKMVFVLIALISYLHVTRTYDSSIEFKKQQFKRCADGEKLKFQHGLVQITGSKQLQFPVSFFDVVIKRIHFDI